MKKTKNVCLVVLCVAMLLCLISCGNNIIIISPEETEAEETQKKTSEPEETSEKVPEPSNGYVFEEISIGSGSSPLTIETIGTGGYYIVLDPITLVYEGDSSFEEYRTKMFTEYSYTKFYVRAGSTVVMNVPLGEYRIYYAAGDSWYGEDDLFGKDTVYAKCDDTFVFTESQGWTLHLYSVANGNLDTDIISKKEFPG